MGVRGQLKFLYYKYYNLSSFGISFFIYTVFMPWLTFIHKTEGTLDCDQTDEKDGY